MPGISSFFPPYCRVVTCIVAFVFKCIFLQCRTKQRSFSLSIDRFSAEKVGGILIVSYGARHAGY